VTDNDGNATRKSWASAVLQCVSHILSRLKTRRAVVRSGNGFSIDVVTHA